MHAPTSNRSHWRWSLAARLATVWAILLGITVGGSSWIANRDARERLLENFRRSIEQDAGRIGLKLETWMEAFQEDARSCSRSPLVVEFLEKRNTGEEARWRQLLEDEFRAVFAGKPAYFQMRLLSVGGADDGHEIVRLDRKDGRLEVTPPELLQSKGARSYYQEALAAPPGEIYLSEIDLNRDFGHITEPHIPTIRAAVKIAGESSGEAMLIINADLRPLFDETRKLSSPASEIRLFNSSDNYLLHPAPGAAFAADLGRGLRPADEYPELQASMAASTHSGWLRDGKSGGELALSTRVPFGGWPSRGARFTVSLPGHAWYPEVRRSRLRAIGFTALAAVLGAGVAVLVSLPFSNRLRRLSSSLRQFDASELPAPLPDAGRDEVGTAIERFREMTIKVREQVEQLQRARDEAQEANAAKEAFLAVMSHEIRTPMNAIVGLIRALEANHPPAHQHPILASLKSSASNLMTLLNTALDYTRLREGAIQYASEVFDAAQLVREVGQSFTPSAWAKHLDLRVDAPGTLTVRGDPVRLRQVVNNLVNNAVKFTGKGFVRVSLRHVGDFLECAVSDSGVGIKEEDQTTVFVPFASRRSGGSPESGAGLGLAVSRQLIEAQGGQLVLQSRPGEGSTFTVRLPYQESTPVLKESDCGSTGNARRLRAGLRILHVEDVRSNQEVMAMTLQGAGVDLVCVETGAEAILEMDRRPFDLLLVDLQLPDMAGDELAKLILASNPQLPVIAVTAQSSPQATERCHGAGIRAVVLKPYTAEALLNAIAENTAGAFTEALEALHPNHPDRSRELASIMAAELRAAARELESTRLGDDRPKSFAEIKRVRHKLQTAIARFQLDELGDVLDDLMAEEKHNPCLIQSAVDLLEQAAARLDRLT